MATADAPAARRLTAHPLAPVRPPHPVYGGNWHFGDQYDPPGLINSDPRHGDAVMLGYDLSGDAYEAVARAAPGEGLAFDAFLNVALREYLAARYGLTLSELLEAAARAKLARIAPRRPRR